MKGFFKTRPLKDCKLSEMLVSWSLRGALLHNVTVACCVGSCMTRNLTLANRCETALAGFLLLDLYALVAKHTCTSMRLPTGSCFMAPQTVLNLQSVALAVAAICATKDASFEPWTRGSCRLSEMAIEQHFSMLRAQSPNAQLSARAYFKAGARVALKAAKQINKEKIRATGSPALTDAQKLVLQRVFNVFHCFSMFSRHVFTSCWQNVWGHSFCSPFAAKTSLTRFVQCSDNALAAALELVSITSNMDKKHLEALYRTACNEQMPIIPPNAPVEEDEMDCLPEQPDQKDKCLEILMEVQDEAPDTNQ